MGQRLSYESSQADWVMPPMYTTGATGNSGATTGATGGTSAVSLGQTYPATGPNVFGATTAPSILDLTTICGTGAKARVPLGNDDWNPDPIAHYITLEADGDDIYVAFGDSPTIMGSINPAYVSTIDGGTITGKTGAASNPFASSGGTLGSTAGASTGCIKIPNNTSRDFKLPVGTPPIGTPYDNSDPIGKYSPARYLSFRSNTGTTAVYLRVYQSSP